VKIEFHNRERDGRSATGGNIKQASRDQLVSTDVWHLSLIVVLANPRSTLADLLDRPNCVRRVERVAINGQGYYKVVLKAPPPVDGYQYTILVDPRHNFLVKEYYPTTNSPKEVLRFEKRVLAFQECAEGIFFPKEVESLVYAVKSPEKTPVMVSRVRFHRVVVNEVIDPSTFDLEFTPGTPVVDERDQTTYVVGKGGKPVGEVRPAPVRKSTLAQPTYAEPPRRRWWPFALGAALLVAGGCGARWLAKRRGAGRRSRGYEQAT
jgi:hypothetical protein